ncbi:MAG: 3-oxoacyl-ACP synthase III family protein [Isosphaeraceae bacterium]
MNRPCARVVGIAHHLPATPLTNEALSDEFPAWDAMKIESKTGIIARRMSAPGECASDLGVRAARALFEQGVVAPADVDFLLFCTQSPDHFLPTTACLVHARLGLRESCASIDVNQGCSGYVYSLALAKGLIEGGLATNVLLVTADTYTKFINPGDWGTRVLFGDGAAVTWVRRDDNGDGTDGPGKLTGPFVFGTDGLGAPNLIVPAGGLRMPATDEMRVASVDESGNRRAPADLYMNGPEVFAFTLRAVPDAVNTLLERAGLHRDDIDLFVFHQANKFMLDRLRDKLGIAPERFVVDLADTGNTVSSSIPIALDRARDQGKLRPGDLVMLVGFGVGYSWAATLIRGF